ncbi:arginine/serine-rich protein 1 [Erinaceus europaeus]|uniref:Arginine/serine-rich protein 1 n=1 Tax=Erinaceus europaeus TaxID=9365 RepID=A0A1S3WAP5_ERIEU|nr:arginine/serine-rich protein 1 [Erinaceus europaeus]XP_016043415.1 arginine/serine-rich protein 1 [Erinaceus europaeus]
MSNYVNDMWPGSPQPKQTPSTPRSGRSSRRSSASGSRSLSRSFRSRSSVSSRSSSRSRSGGRARARARSRRHHQRRYRRYSRSFSRSRSRSRSRRFRPRRHSSSRRWQRARRGGSRSRSRSRGRSWSRRQPAATRGRRYYGFGRSVYPEEPRHWRGRSRTRSRSRTPFRLTEKDRMELLEIAKANAAKALGTTNFDLPASLRSVSVSKTNLGAPIPSGAKFELSEKLTEDGTKNSSEKASQQKSIAFSSKNSIAKPMLQKSAKVTADETSSRSPKIDEKKSPYGLWVPV